MKRMITMMGMGALLFSCRPHQEEGMPGADVALATDTVYVDTPFDQEYQEAFPINNGDAGAEEVRAILPLSSGQVWIATKAGIYRKDRDSRTWAAMLSQADRGPAYDVAVDANGQVWAAVWNGVYRSTVHGLEKSEGPEAPIARLVTAEEGVYALGPHGIWLYHNTTWEKMPYDTGRSFRAALSDGNKGLWLGTDVGLFHANGQDVEVYQGNEDLVSAYVRGIALSDSGQLWVGGMGGVAIRENKVRIGVKTPKEGLPNAMVNTVAKGPDGIMWVGTDYGIARFTPGSSAYSVRVSKRWLMDDQVNDIAFDAQGDAWVATSGGVSVIRKIKMTLAEKADFFYDKLIRRHIRDPWIVARFKLTVPGDTTSIQEDDDDNDGEFTSNYLAMESFRYAVTKSPEAKERAQKAFHFLRYLQQVTGTDGFFARSIIPPIWTEMHDKNRTYTERELAEELIENPRHKPVEVRWHPSADGQWLWKGDTSSDEMCGHLFGYFWYYNLVADAAEKKEVATHFAHIMDHLMAHDYNLVDVDGKPTKWGIWSPDRLNRDWEWSPERALNSLELLGFLKFAYHITGDEKYQREYLRLIQEEGYLENAKKLHDQNPAWETYFDIYLALYLYGPLIQFEDDPSLKTAYKDHMEQWFQKYRAAGSPLVNFTYNLLQGGTTDLAESIFFLKDAPLDLVDHRIDNGAREDLQVVREPVLEDLQTPLRPPSEYRTMRWDRNPYQSIGGIPTQEREPVYWLLPYWMGRYLKLIQPGG